MFTSKKISGVVGGNIRTVGGAFGNGLATSRSRADQTKLTADAMCGGGQGPAAAGSAQPTNVRGFWSSQYQYMLTGLIPADPQQIDSSTLSLFYRDIYLLDNTAGSAVDILSSFPFSDWELRGQDDHVLKVYNDALERLNLRPLLPQISTSYLVDGFFCGSLVFDARRKQFMDILKHDALQCSILPSPFGNIDPTINVHVGQATSQFISDTSVYAKNYLAQMPPQFMEMLRQGQFTLDPITTLFVGRQSLVDRAYTSFLHRILPMYLIEKMLYRGMLVEASRRQRAMTLVTAGDDTWVPTEEELNAIVNAFQTAEADPLGGWVAMRNAVQTVDLRPGGDFWRYDDVADRFVPYKLRAMGISEAFLSGDTSFAAAESAYSVFLETQDSYRFHLTDQIFDRKLFPLIATVNELFIDPNIYGSNGGKPSIEQILFDSTNRANMKLPKLHWNKSLEAHGEENMMDMLEKLDERGIPIPIKMWLAAAGVDSDALKRDLKDDGNLRKLLSQYTGKDTSHEGNDDYGREDDDEYDVNASVFGKTVRKIAATLAGKPDITSIPMHHATKAGHTGRVGIMNREFSENDSLMYESNKSGSGKKHIFNQKGAKANAHQRIVKIATAMNRDQNYRKSVANRIGVRRQTNKLKTW